MANELDKQCKVKKNKGTVRILFEGDLNVERVSALREIMRKALKGARRIKINIEKSASVDPSFLQLICSLHKTAISSGIVVECEGEFPECFVTLMQCVGYKRNLCDVTGEVSSCLWVEKKQ